MTTDQTARCPASGTSSGEPSMSGDREGGRATACHTCGRTVAIRLDGRLYPHLPARTQTGGTEHA